MALHKIIDGVGIITNPVTSAGCFLRVYNQFLNVVLIKFNTLHLVVFQYIENYFSSSNLLTLIFFPFVSILYMLGSVSNRQEYIKQTPKNNLLC